MASYEPPYGGIEPQPPGGHDGHERDGTPAPSPGPGTPGTATATASGRQSGGSQDVVGSIPALNVPQGNAVLIREGPVQFRFVEDRFEGVDIKRSPQEIGELQFVLTKNALTDEQTIRKRQASDTVSSSAAEATIGIHEVSGVRELTLDAMDAVTGWTESDAANFSRTLDTSIKVEGTGSLRFNTTGVGANGDTLKKDLGAGATLDLSKFDYVELLVRGVAVAGNQITFAMSEDDVAYTAGGGFTGTTTATWETLRVDLTAIAAASRDAIRYLRFVCDNGATAQVWYVDIIRAVRRVQHRLMAERLFGGSSTGGVRDFPADVSLAIKSDESGVWVTKATIETVPGFTKMRAVDWFGDTYIMLGAGGALKYANGVLSVWEEAPPSHFLALHYDKLWALSQTWEPHGLRHTTVNSTTAWPLDTDPVGGDGGLFYVGRRHGFLPTGMVPAFGQLFVLTEGDCWILFGSNNQSFILQRAHPGAGTLSHESIAAVDDGLLWHDGLADRVILWRGGNVVDVGVPIQPDLREIPASRKPWTAAVTDGRYYYLSYTRAGQTINDRTRVLDTRTLQWHGPFEGNWVGFTDAYLSVDGSMYFGTEAGGVRKVHDHVAGAEGSRAFAIKSAALNFRIPGYAKRIRRWRAKGEGLTTGQAFTLNFYTEQSAAAIRSYALVAAGGATEILATGVHNDVVGDNIQWELTESSANAVTISQVAIDGYYVRALRASATA